MNEPTESPSRHLASALSTCMSHWTPLLLPASVDASFLSLPATLIDSTLLLTEYALYAIEQRLTARDPLALVVVLTGQSTDELKVDRYRIDASEEAVRRLFPVERLVTTVHGLLPVTSLSSLPSSVSLVQLSSGDFSTHKDALYESIALRRLGLSGRSALSLTPSQAARSNFRSLFKIKPFHILDLVIATQEALVLYKQFERQPDGLLCDESLEGLSYFYEEIAEPLGLMPDQRNDSSLTPALFASLISTVLAAKSRLNICGYQPPRDPFRHPRRFSRALKAFNQDLPPHLSLSMIKLLAEKAASKRDSDIPLARLLPTHVNRTEFSETNDIDKLIESLKKDGSRLARLWLGDPNESSGSESDYDDDDDDDRRERADDGTLANRKRSKRLLKGVRSTVGRAGRRIGDNLGLSALNEASRPPISRQSSMTEVRASTTSRSGRESTKARSTSSSAQRPTLKSQRLVSEAFLHVKAPQRSRSPASFNDQATHDHAWDDEQDDEHDETGSPTAGRKRRYTINTVEDCQLPPRLMLPQHLQADVALRVASVLLRTKEKELADLAHSLQLVNDSYEAAIKSLEPTYQTRTSHLRQVIAEAERVLSQTSQPLPERVELESVMKRLAFARSSASASLEELGSATQRLDSIRPSASTTNGLGDSSSKLEEEVAEVKNEQRRMRHFYELVTGLRERLSGTSRPKQASASADT